MSKTVGDYLWERPEWGVKTIFGYPGDGINGLLGALNRAGGRFEFIQVRHEEMAAFMASAYAKFTGRLGVCMATSGPGASHLLTGLYDAKLDHMPVLAIAGQQARAGLGATTSKSSISRACLKMSLVLTSHRHLFRHKHDTWSIGPSASPSASVKSRL